jgi:hypothetical protein
MDGISHPLSIHGVRSGGTYGIIRGGGGSAIRNPGAEHRGFSSLDDHHRELIAQIANSTGNRSSTFICHSRRIFPPRIDFRRSTILSIYRISLHSPN